MKLAILLLGALVSVIGNVLFVVWCLLLVVGLLISWMLWDNRYEANGCGAFGKIGFWLFGVLLAVSVALKVLL